MTKQEFEALGITKYDLVAIYFKDTEDYEDVCSVGFISYFNLEQPWRGAILCYTNSLVQFKNKKCESALQWEFCVDNIERVQVITRNFWSEE